MNEMLWTFNDRRFSGRSGFDTAAPRGADLPLVVALHGGTYTSRYFDVPGHSLLRRAQALNIPAIAIDRPGYGTSALVNIDETSQTSNAAILDQALGDLWTEAGRDHVGIVLLGHSIGGAIALRIAGRRLSWPLLGIAISGVGVRIAPGAADAAERFPPAAFIEMPREVKNSFMFGVPKSFSASSVEASWVADAPTPARELIEIVTQWPRDVGTTLAAIDVPIHYRQGADDHLWEVNSGEIADFANACVKAPAVDARIVDNAGHCIDFHRVGASFQLDQLAFALRCGVNAKISQEQK